MEMSIPGSKNDRSYDQPIDFISTKYTHTYINTSGPFFFRKYLGNNLKWYEK